MKKKKSTLLIVGMSFLLSIGTLMFSSCADKDDPSPILPTPEDTSYILKLKFSEKVEFKEILNKNDIQDLTETETAYFGERIQRSCPHELQFDRDSLSIVKTNNIVEKYKLKWQDKKSPSASRTQRAKNYYSTAFIIQLIVAPRKSNTQYRILYNKKQ